MDVDKYQSFFEKFKNNPRRTIRVSAFILVGSAAAIWANGFFGEIGREHGSRIAGAPPSIFQETPQVRVTYYRFEGSILLRHVLSGTAFDPADGFAFRPIIIKNDVYRDLETIFARLATRELPIRNRAGLPYDGMSFFGVDSRGNPRFEWALSDEDESGNRKIRQQFENGPGPLRGASIHYDFSKAELQSHLLARPEWTIAFDPAHAEARGTTIPWHGFSFVGTLTNEEALTLTGDPLTRAVLSRRKDLDDLVLLTAYAEHEGYTALVWVRELKLLAVGIENVGEGPLGLSSLIQRTIVRDPYDARTAAEQDRLAQRARVGNVPLPVELLRPGEHLLIPLGLELGFATNAPLIQPPNYEGTLQRSFFPTRWWKNWPEDTLTFEILRGVNENYEAVVDHWRVPRSVLSTKVDLAATFVDTYFLGSSIRVEGVEFRTGSGTPTRYPIRRMDLNNLAARGGYEVGSCPVLYLSADGENVLRRPVLINAVTRGRLSTDSIRIPPEVDGIALVEEEDEIAFIDAAALRITDESGRSWTIPHRARGEDLLRARDGKFLRMEKGDTITLSFEIPPRLQVHENRQVVFTGFYVPYELLSVR